MKIQWCHFSSLICTSCPRCLQWVRPQSAWTRQMNCEERCHVGGSTLNSAVARIPALDAHSCMTVPWMMFVDRVGERITRRLTLLWHWHVLQCGPIIIVFDCENKEQCYDVTYARIIPAAFRAPSNIQYIHLVVVVNTLHSSLRVPRSHFFLFYVQYTAVNDSEITKSCMHCCHTSIKGGLFI